MPKMLELRKVVAIPRNYGIEFDFKSGGRHTEYENHYDPNPRCFSG